MAQNNLLDANAILRYLLGDSEEQANQTSKKIEEGSFTLSEVICEVVYVLNKVYKIDRSKICNVLLNFLNEIEIDNKPVVKNALEYYSMLNLDFVDCELLSRSIILGDNIFTFDKKLNGYIKKEKERLLN